MPSSRSDTFPVVNGSIGRFGLRDGADSGSACPAKGWGSREAVRSADGLTEADAGLDRGGDRSRRIDPPPGCDGRTFGFAEEDGGGPPAPRALSGLSRSRAAIVPPR